MPPVEDSAPHPITIRNRPIAGCSNKPPFNDKYYALSRHYFTDGTFYLRIAPVKHRMSKLCRQLGEYREGKWHDLDECRECTRPKDTEYIERNRKLTDAHRSSPSANRPS